MQTVMQSKVWVPARKGKLIFGIVLNICLALILLAGALKCLFDGVDLQTLGGMALAFGVVAAYKNRPDAKGRYAVVLMDILLQPTGLSLSYQEPGKTQAPVVIELPLENITGLEYSDQLVCLHFIGKFWRVSNTEKLPIQEYFLYLEKGREREILQMLKDLPIVYMDRP